MPRGPVWSEHDLRILIEHYPYKENSEIVGMLESDRSEKDIVAKVVRMKIKKKVRKKSTNPGTNPWSEEELAKLREIYPVIENIQDVLEFFPGRTMSAIYGAASVNNISRRISWTKCDGEERAEPFNIESILDERPWRKQLWLDFLLAVKKLDRVSGRKDLVVHHAVEYVRGVKL